MASLASLPRVAASSSASSSSGPSSCIHIRSFSLSQATAAKTPEKAAAQAAARMKAKAKMGGGMQFDKDGFPIDNKGGDKRIVDLRTDLYPPGVYDRGFNASPVSVARANRMELLNRKIPIPEIHETIQRAERLYYELETERKEKEFEWKKKAMIDACEALRVWQTSKDASEGIVDPATGKETLSHYSEACEMRASMLTPTLQFAPNKVEGLFPRDLQLPYETPSATGWMYDWTYAVPTAKGPKTMVSLTGDILTPEQIREQKVRALVAAASQPPKLGRKMKANRAKRLETKKNNKALQKKMLSGDAERIGVTVPGGTLGVGGGGGTSNIDGGDKNGSGSSESS